MTRRRPPLHAPITIPITFVNAMLGGVRARGEPFADDLLAAGIAPELLLQAGARITANQYVALYRSLMERHGDEMLGLLTRPLKRGSFTLISRAAIGAPTIGQALRRAAHAFRLLQDDVSPEPVRDGRLGGLALRFHMPAPAQQNFLHELLIRIFWRLMAWLAGGRFPAARFDFAFPPPPYAGSYGAVFPAPLRFAQPLTAFWFDAAQLDVPVRRAESALRTLLADAQAYVIVPQRDADAVSARLRSHLQDSQPQWPGLAACAETLHMSPATLQRHLAAEGTTFQQLKDELRRDLAIVRLNTSAVPLSALAEELGFSDRASFQRAFKSWTGSAPGPYRRGRT